MKDFDLGPELWWWRVKLRSFYYDRIERPLRPVRFRLRHLFCGKLQPTSVQTTDGVTYTGKMCAKCLVAIVGASLPVTFSRTQVSFEESQ